MNRARSFFFVCLGILCIIAAYHLGATRATAQAPSGVDCVSCGSNRDYSAVIDGYEWYILSGVATRIPVPVPGRAIACYNYRVLLDDGRCFAYISGEWSLEGTLPIGGATPAQSTSIGQLKAKYAAPAKAEK